MFNHPASMFSVQPSTPTANRHEAANLRWARLSDVPALTELYRKAHQNNQETQETMAGWLDRGGSLVLQNESGALLCALRWREAGDGWEIDRVATVPQARGQGYGRWLLTKLEALAIRNNIATLSLALSDPDAELLAYYQRMGYQLVEQNGADVQLHKRVGGVWQYKR